MNLEDYDLYQSNFISYSFSSNTSLKISSSSTAPDLTINNISTIDAILDCSEKRWVSAIENNPFFIIEFPFGSFYLQSYIFKSTKNFRYSYQWKVDGLTNHGWKTIDEQNRDDMCDLINNGACLHDIKKMFIAKNPRFVTKLRFTATGVDSRNESIFSLTQLMLFGQYDERMYCCTPFKKMNVIISLFLNTE